MLQYHARPSVWTEICMQRAQPEQWFCNHSSTFPGVQYIVCTSACFEESARVSACDNVPCGCIWLSGVAEQGETGMDPRETFNLAKFKLKFRAVLVYSMFSKGPQQSLYFSQNDFDKLGKWFGRNRMQFNRDKYWILHLGRNNELFTCSMQKYRVD